MKVFISYSHKDERHVDDLKRHLAPVFDAGNMQTWDDRRIEAGADWENDIKKALEAADAALLIVSAHFLDSRYCTKVEVPKLFEARAARGLKIVPVIVGDCMWKRVGWLSQLKALPKDGKSLPARGVSRDKALLSIAEQLDDMARAPRANDSGSPPDVAGSQTLREPHPSVPPKPVEPFRSGAWNDKYKEWIPSGPRFWSNDVGVKKDQGPYQMIPGPFVVTYVALGGELRVLGGPPWEAESDDMEISTLRGDNFRGQFFIRVGWYAEALSESCLVSGFFPYEGKPIDDRTELPSGGVLYARHSMPKTIRLSTGDGAGRYLEQAHLEAQAAYGAELEIDEWEQRDGEWIAYVSPKPFERR